MSNNRLRWVSVGGTFDVMHKGHWFLLEETFNVGERAIVGVTTDEFAVSLKKQHEIDSYENRRRDVVEFLKDKGFLERAEIVPLRDPFGPTIDSDILEGLIVSEETEVTAEVINKMRVEQGRKPLLIFVITMVLADDGKPISSTRVRRQEVDRYGRLIG
ncbi:MAG TPA: pantetheine-phosphate adenylyltransferase [Candidatus Desulfaltia sp.]|nr:pantetheine-phosphate adenylyltransferase [Candidatus Desulfaltia sp.]